MAEQVNGNPNKCTTDAQTMILTYRTQLVPQEISYRKDGIPLRGTGTSTGIVSKGFVLLLILTTVNYPKHDYSQQHL